MKVTQDEIVDRQTVLHIELEEDDLGPYLDYGYRRLVQKTRIPGFRTGKAPRQVVERFAGREGLLSEAMDFVLADATSRAARERSLETAGVPRFEVLAFDPVTIKATVALRPQVDLGDYRQIRVAANPVEVTDAAVDARVETLRREAAVWSPVDRPLRMGDMCSMDLRCAANGKDVADRRGDVYTLTQEAPDIVPGFGDRLVGMQAEETREFTLLVPEDFRDTDLAGMEALFSVTAREFKEAQVPDLDDEFAKGVGPGFDNLAALRDHVRKELETEAENAERTRFRNATVDALMASASVELPPMLVEHEAGHLRAERYRMLTALGFRREDFLRTAGMTEEQEEQDLRSEASRRLTNSLVLSRLGELEGVEVPESEVEEKLRTLPPGSAALNRRRPRGGSSSESAREAVRDTLLATAALTRLEEVARGQAPESGGDEAGGEQTGVPPGGGEARDLPA